MTRMKSLLAILAAACTASGCAVYEVPVVAQPYYAQAPVYVEPAPQVVYVAPQPVYVVPQPVYVYPPVRFGLGLSYRSGYRGGYYGRGRYRY
jgi:hypothetical protein